MQAVGLDLPFQTAPTDPWINTWLVSDNVQVAPQEVEVSSLPRRTDRFRIDADDLATSSSDETHFLKISDTRLECQDEHPSLLAALESHQYRRGVSCREATAAPAVYGWFRGRFDWLTEPLALSSRERFSCCCRQSDIEIEM
ncbi:Ferredoxin [Klebsiella michiganensis]|nr:Ferredoxin [Klebsiella michiganensis]